MKLKSNCVMVKEDWFKAEDEAPFPGIFLEVFQRVVLSEGSVDGAIVQLSPEDAISLGNHLIAMGTKAKEAK